MKIKLSDRSYDALRLIAARKDPYGWCCRPAEAIGVNKTLKSLARKGLISHGQRFPRPVITEAGLEALEAGA